MATLITACLVAVYFVAVITFWCASSAWVAGRDAECLPKLVFNKGWPALERLAEKQDTQDITELPACFFFNLP